MILGSRVWCRKTSHWQDPITLQITRAEIHFFLKCGAPKYLPQIPRQFVSYEVQPLQRYPSLIVLPDKEQAKKVISLGHVIP
jgi:hypothetical protein